jgi:hypothetical protein
MPLLSALALLVPGVLADDHHATVTTDHLAVLADPLDAGSNLHLERFLLVAIGDPTPGDDSTGTGGTGSRSA